MILPVQSASGPGVHLNHAALALDCDDALLELIEKMAANREQVLAEVRRRWREGDSNPLLPKFGGAARR